MQEQEKGQKIYRALEAIPELGIPEGATVIFAPRHPRHPVQVVRLLGWAQVRELEKNLGKLELLSGGDQVEEAPRRKGFPDLSAADLRAMEEEGEGRRRRTHLELLP